MTSGRPLIHCNDEVLHAPGVCGFCDDYPDRQAARAASGGGFSPPEANGWQGNVAQPKLIMEDAPNHDMDDWGRSAAMTPCRRWAPRGWQCTRMSRGDHAGQCALRARWWNVMGWLQ